MGGKAKHSQCCMKATPDGRMPASGSIRSTLHKASPSDLFRGSRSDARRFSDLALDCRRYDGPKDKACSNAFQQYVLFLAK